MKTGRGWWALAGVVALTLLGVYVGAYYATVSVYINYDHEIPPPQRPLYAGGDSPVLKAFFAPIHQIDRLIRPQEWSVWR